MKQANYSEIRKELKTGDLLAWDKVKKDTKGNFVLYWYQKILKAKYVHVGVVAKIGKRYFVIEATPPVVRIYPISLLSDFVLIKTNLDLSKGNKSRYLNILFKELGKKYSIFDLVRNIFRVKNNKSTYYCSELAGYFYKETGLIDDKDKAGFTPDSLIETVMKKTGNEPLMVKLDRGNFNGI